jgi:hypothetical protein
MEGNTDGNMEEMATLPSFTAEQKFLMKKALYYDFMLFHRNNKPFNAFLKRIGLTNPMYTPPQSVVARYSDARGINRYDEGLHIGLSSPTSFNPIDNINLAFISERFEYSELNKTIFSPKTSEQIDQGIKTLVDNFQPGAPLYDCSTDAVMRAIIAGKFDEFLSDQNKEDMMRICAAPTGLGGKNKRRSKNKSKLKKTKKLSRSRSRSRSKSRSKSRSRSRSKNTSRSKRGGAPSYVGSIQGRFINHKGQQLFINPTGGIA